MKALIARLGSPNLSKPWFYETCLSNSARSFLSPSPTTQILIRGAKSLDCGISWVRPTYPSCISKEVSGDMEGVPQVPSDRVIADLRKSQLLKTAPAAVQKMYTFKYLDRVRRKGMIEEVLVEEVRRHNYDVESDEVRLALMTCTIRRLQFHMERYPRDKRNKVVLKQTIEKRRQRLKVLRRCNYPLFEWLLEKLNLVYIPPPLDPTPAMRSFGMIEIATKFCEELKAAKLKKYREELETRKPDFLEKKARIMRAIVDDERKVKVTPSFTDEDIAQVDLLRSRLLEERAKISKPVIDIF